MIDECWLGHRDGEEDFWLQPFRSGYHYETRDPRPGFILTPIPNELYARFCQVYDTWSDMQVELEEIYKARTQNAQAAGLPKETPSE